MGHASDAARDASPVQRGATANYSSVGELLVGSGTGGIGKGMVILCDQCQFMFSFPILFSIPI